MTLLGMQMDTQCGSYIPECYSVRDLTLDANGSTWPPLNNVSILMNGHYYNSTLLVSSPDQHLGYNKEILKQTMLKHEAMFRDQVHELHQLYRRQRELMDEMKRDELHKHQLQVETLQSNPVLSQNSIEYTQKTWQVPSLPRVKPACSQSSAEHNLSPMSFVEGKSMQAGPDPAQTEGSSKDSELLESKCKKIGNKILDLQLPADVYADNEEEEPLEEENVPKVPGVSSYPLKKISQGLCEIGVKSSLSIGGLNSVFQEDNMTFSSYPEETKVLVDLNEPVKLEEEAALKFSDVPESVTGPGDIPCSGERDSEFQFLSKEIIPNTQTRKDPEACSRVLHPEKNERKQESLSYDDEPGQTRCDLNFFPQGCSAEKAFTSFADVVLKQALELPTSPLLDESNIESCMERKTNLDSLGDLPTMTYTETVTASDMCTSNQLIPQADVENSALSLVLSRRKRTREWQRAPIAIQALPCFNTSKPLRKSSKLPIGGPGLAGSKHSSSTKNLKCCPKYDSARFPWSRFCKGSQSESRTLDTYPPSINDGLSCSDDNDSASEHHGPTKCIKGSKDVTFAKNMDLNFISPSCSLEESASQNDQITDGEMELEDSSGESSSQASAAKIHRCPSEDEDIENTEKYGVLDTSLDGDPAPDSRERLNANELVADDGLDKKISGFGFSIDLNLCINEDESSPTASQSAEMDLQAPASPENKESSPPRGESNENQLEVGGSDANQLEIQLPEQEDGDPQAELVSIAAEAIVTISSVVETCVESATCQPSELPWIESLHWFAKVVSSVVDGPESEFGATLSGKDSGDHGYEDCRSDGMDYFEAMTLQLTETKVEDYLYNNFQKEKETRAASLPSQPKRGRTRRGRQQRKDFQSEILPSLASLSRYEVTEDLQTIGGLIEAAGAYSGLCRYAGRTGWTRGRRQSCVSSSNVRESTMNLLLKQQASNTDMAIDERSLIQWGKITRRRRGQRCPATNLRPILGQV